MKQFNELPADVQERIKNTLKAYDDVTVWFEDGNYNFGTCIKNYYAPDHEFIGTFTAKEIYTDVERIENYINEFCSYPKSYTGKRDYSIIRKMKEREYDASTNTLTIWQGKINANGDFELTGKETFTI